MTEHIDQKPRLLFPGLRSFYDVAIPLAWPVIRIAVGWTLLVHGWGKVVRGPSAYVRPFMEQGFDPALPWIWAALIIEFVGGIALILGLFTRFFAAAAAIEFSSSPCFIGKPGSPGSTAVTNTRCSGASSASRSRCGAGDHTRSIARSASSSKAKTARAD